MSISDDDKSGFRDELSSNDYKEILENSYQLLQQAYDEVKGSIESVNTRSGIALALIGTAVTAADFQLWKFGAFTCSSNGFLWLLINLPNLLNLSSLLLFFYGTTLIAWSLRTNLRRTPYNIESINEQNDKKYLKRYQSLEAFYRLQMADFAKAFEAAQETLSRKGVLFNKGVFMVLLALGILVMVKLMS